MDWVDEYLADTDDWVERVKTCFWILVTLALLLGAFAVAVHVGHTHHHPAVVRCEEDEPCWNCHTMGNERCGPGA